MCAGRPKDDVHRHWLSPGRPVHTVSSRPSTAKRAFSPLGSAARTANRFGVRRASRSAVRSRATTSAPADAWRALESAMGNVRASDANVSPRIGAADERPRPPGTPDPGRSARARDVGIREKIANRGPLIQHDPGAVHSETGAGGEATFTSANARVGGLARQSDEAKAAPRGSITVPQHIAAGFSGRGIALVVQTWLL